MHRAKCAAHPGRGGAQGLLSKLQVAADIRAKTLQDGAKGFALDAAKKLTPVVASLFTGKIGAKDFPIQLEVYSAIVPSWDSQAACGPAAARGALGPPDRARRARLRSAKEPDAEERGGSLLPALTMLRAGSTTMSIEIQKIGLKARTHTPHARAARRALTAGRAQDALEYIESRVTVTVAGAGGPQRGAAGVREALGAGR